MDNTEKELKERVKSLALESGFSEVGELDIASLEYFPWVREICEGNSCRSYNSCWACPPAVGSLEECRKRCEGYGNMLLFSKVYSLSGSFDVNGMMASMEEFRERVRDFDRKLRPFIGRRLMLTNEGCGRCKECTWPDEPCRFPEELHHSVEGYGFNVTALAKASGLKYNNGPGTVTYFGAVLFGEAKEEKAMKYTIDIAGMKRELPIFPVTEDLSIGAFVIFGDVEITVHAARELLERAPEFDVIAAPEAKAIPLAYEMSRQCGKPYVVARKKAKAYMSGVLSVTVKSITTAGEQTLIIDSADAEKMKGKRVIILDDVISTGESLRAMEALVEKAGGIIAARMAVLAEGESAGRKDITVLADLPLFNADGSVKK